MSWLEPSELRVGLGCMRLADPDVGGEPNGLATIAAALDAGISVFDTAHAYGGAGANERLLAQAIQGVDTSPAPKVITKGGMTRATGAWVPDGRARTIQADCTASLEALGGHPIDLYLLHAPDPRTAWTTSLRALRRLVDEKLVRGIGLSNVNRLQLEQALEIAPIAAVEVPLSLFDDRALRGGVLELCDRHGLTLIAYSPLGGPRRRGGASRSEALTAVATEVGATPAEVALAWLLQLSPLVVPIPGARRPESARSAARAASLRLDRSHVARLEAAHGVAGPTTGAMSKTPRAGAEVVLLMGIPGAGKSRLAQTYVARGYLRLNRDERGGSLPQLAAELDGVLGGGEQRVLLDNTYLTRASRSRVIEAAARHGVSVRCVWLNTPLAQAQVNLVERLLERFGSLPDPEQLRALGRSEPGLHTPATQMRTVRELEPPAADEGFSTIERVEFEREPRDGLTGGAVFVAAPALDRDGLAAELNATPLSSPLLLFDWCPGGAEDALEGARARLEALAGRPVAAAFCPHPGGPPVCWCRPPLPGLLLDFARARGVDPGRSIVIGTTRTHLAMATALGARYA